MEKAGKMSRRLDQRKLRWKTRSPRWAASAGLRQAIWARDESWLIAPVGRSGHHLRLHLHRSSGAGRAGQSVAGRTIRCILDRTIVDQLRGRARRQRCGGCRGIARSTYCGISRRQRTEASSIGAPGRTATSTQSSGEGQAAAHLAHATAAARRAERAAAVAIDRAAAHRTEGVVLTNTELGAAAAATTAAVMRDQAETTSPGERLGSHDAGDNQGQDGGGEQFFHDGGVRES